MELPPEERRAFLEHACGPDLELEEEVWELVRTSEQESPTPPRPAAAPRDLDSPDPWLGTQLKQRYRIARKLGEGGFASVYLATDADVNDRPVVIKILQQHRLSAWQVKKFDQEKAALAMLRHPRIVDILDAGRTELGNPFLVLEFLEGETLQKTLSSQEPLDLKLAADWVAEIADALTAAHSKGIYHRDLKPANVILKPTGSGRREAVVIDFGIATVKESGEDDTKPTQVVGSCRYMAPEQIMGHPGAASDIYALAVLAFEMAAGRPPITTDNPFSMYIHQKEHRYPDLQTLRAEVPRESMAAIRRALSFDPAQRYPTANEFAAAFAEPIRAAAGGAPRADRLDARLLAGLGCAALAAIGFLAWSNLRPSPVAPASPPTRPPAESAPPAVAQAPVKAPVKTVEPPKAPVEASTRPPRAVAAAPAYAPPAARAAQPVEFQIRTVPVTANLRIDGDGTPLATNTKLSLAPGVHTYRVFRNGYREQSGEFRIPASGAAEPLQLSLVRQSSKIEISTDPPGAQIVLDDAVRTETTPATLTVDPGHHRVVLRLGGARKEVLVESRDGEAVRISEPLRERSQ